MTSVLELIDWSIIILRCVSTQRLYCAEVLELVLELKFKNFISSRTLTVQELHLFKNNCSRTTQVHELFLEFLNSSRTNIKFLNFFHRGYIMCANGQSQFLK